MNMYNRDRKSKLKSLNLNNKGECKACMTLLRFAICIVLLCGFVVLLTLV